MNIINVVNTIRDNQSAEYQARIPEATRANVEDVRFAMLDSDNINCANDFMSSLMNKLVKSVIHTKMFANPLKQFKKGTKPVGDTIEEIYQNFIKGDVYDANGVDLLGRKLPDTKTVYHKMNYKQKYKVTVSRELLSKAFTSWEALENYVKTVINTLYNSAELDEFLNMKELIKSAVENNAVVVKAIREACHRVLYTQTNSLVINGMSTDSIIIYNMPWWEKAINDAQVVLGCITATLFALSVASFVIHAVKKEN